MFTPAGIAELKKILLKERTKRISDWVAEMDTIYNIKEDTALIRETFNECNAEANTDNFILKIHEITFWKEYCFPHVVRPYDTNLDITFSYKELEKFLSENGKRLLRQKKE